MTRTMAEGNPLCLILEFSIPLSLGNLLQQTYNIVDAAIATAVSVFCSQNLGAGKIQRIKKGLLQGILVGVTYGITAGVVLILQERDLAVCFYRKTKWRC